MITEKKTANAMGGKTARACDSCLRKRARWFCAADDAFLCQACDTSVHSANQLASRHERVRLQTSSNKGGSAAAMSVLDDYQESSPAWHRGFTRKARTPRHNNKNTAPQQAKYDDIEKVLNGHVDHHHHHDTLPFVPEMSNEDESPIHDENEEEQLLYRVPVFDPFAAELCNPIGDDERPETTTAKLGKEFDQRDGNSTTISTTPREAEFDHQINGFLPSELELAEFAADVESLLGGGMEEDQSCARDLKGLEMELLGCKEEDDFDIDIDIDVDVCINSTEQSVKVEEEEAVVDQVNHSSMANYHEENKAVVQTKKRDILLRLNHEAVIAAWASQGSPWTTGIRPDFNPDHGWPDCLDVCHTDVLHANGDSSRGGLGLGLGGGSISDGGREARVSRYREKRRTRLFSKKIRYEVRKLNAEKRPRMKGRFVKRTSFMSTSTTNSTSGTTFPYQLMMSK